MFNNNNNNKNLKLSIDQFKKDDIIKFNNTQLKIIDIINNNNNNNNNLKKKGKILFKIKFENNIIYLNKNELFKLLTINKRKIFTHNCQQRLICGQLGSIASRMALDDNQATTIDGTHKGAGMVKAQGIVSNIQYYFEDPVWIEKWFKKRGLTSKGWEPGEDPNDLDYSKIDLGEDEDISINEDKTEIDFNGIHREIDNTKDQKFEQL